jgi:hypothetical protein
MFKLAGVCECACNRRYEMHVIVFQTCLFGEWVGHGWIRPLAHFERVVISIRAESPNAAIQWWVYRHTLSVHFKPRSHRLRDVGTPLGKITTTCFLNYCIDEYGVGIQVRKFHRTREANVGR